MLHGPTTNAFLVLRLRDPLDEAAWSEFVQIYRSLIYNLVRQKGFQDADASELTQDVLLVVIRAINRWEPDHRGSFRGWLFTIARHLMINFLASPARRFSGSGRTSVLEDLLQQPERDYAESQLFDLELKRRLFEWAAERVRARIEPATWEAFWQTAVLARQAKEVAREMGLTVGAVYVARSRVMHQLRRLIEIRLCREDFEEVCDA